MKYFGTILAITMLLASAPAAAGDNLGFEEGTLAGWATVVDSLVILPS